MLLLIWQELPENKSSYILEENSPEAAWRRSAIEPVIGHLKADGHLGRNFLRGRHGDRNNTVLSAIGHNLRPSGPQIAQTFVGPDPRYHRQADPSPLSPHTGFLTDD